MKNSFSSNSNTQPPHSSLNAKSKKIKKLSKEPVDAPKREFKSKLEQKAFLDDFRKALSVRYQKLDKLEEGQIFSVADLHTIQTDDLASYDECLVQVLDKRGESTGGLRPPQWRKKVNEWIKNLNKPDNRGGRLIPQRHEGVFKQRVLAILSNLEIRNYGEFVRGRIIEAAQDLLEGEDNDPTKEKSNTFSDNWWFGYLEKNSDVKEVWTDISLRRTFEKEQREIQELTIDYFLDELVKSGNIRFCLQEPISNSPTSQIWALDEDLL